MIKRRRLYYSKQVKTLDNLEKKYKKNIPALYYNDTPEVLELSQPESDANLVSSEVWNNETASFTGKHCPTIDIDMPVYAVPSKSPGHTHLYIEKELTWKQYEKLLIALTDCGIVEKGYTATCRKHGRSFLRKTSYDKLTSIFNND